MKGLAQENLKGDMQGERGVRERGGVSFSVSEAMEFSGFTLDLMREGRLRLAVEGSSTLHTDASTQKKNGA